MAGKDLFAPPTKDEIELVNSSLFAPPTEDEKKVAAGPEEYGWKDFARATIDTVLPVAGAVGGGALALPTAVPTFGIGPVAAAGGGYMAGKNLADVAKNYLFDDPLPESYGEIASRAAGNFMEGATAEAGGQVLNIGAKALANKAGTLVSKGADTIASAKQKLSVGQSQSAGAQAQGAAKSSASISGGGTSVENSGNLFSFKAPQSLDELRSWQPKPNSGAMPGKERLKEIVQIVPDLETQPLNYHFDMMENPKAMKELKLRFENLPTKDAKKIASYNQQMVEESTQKIGETVKRLGEPKDLSDAGLDLIATVKDNYRAEREALAPLFEELKERAVPLGADEAAGLVVAIGQKSKVGKLLARNAQTQRLELRANTPRSGISDSEHGILSRVIDDLNDGITFKELQDTREFLRKSVDPANPAASEEISKVRSALLEQLENMSGAYGEGVRDTFRAYAKNERARESIEKVIGGRIESLDSMFAANPDKVVQKIFSNPNYVKVVGDYVGEEKINELVASYLNQGVLKATDKAKGFNPSAFKSWLKQNNNFIKANVDPEIGARLDALADYGYYGKRFLDEVNPSGTAASLKEMLEPGSFLTKVRTQGVTGAVTSEAAQRVGAFTKQKQAVKAINEALGQTQGTKVNIGLGGGLKSMANAPGAATVASEFVRRKATAEASQMLEGFPLDRLIALPPEEVEQRRKELASNNSLNSIEKVRRLNLLNKHGMLPIE